MRRLRRTEIERRLAICEAKRDNPDLRYIEIQEQFHAGPSIVASALKGGIDTWLEMLGRAPAKAEGTTSAQAGKPASTKWEYIGVEISSVENADGSISYRARDDGEAELGIAGLKAMAGVLGAYGKLGWELAGIEKISKGAAAFAGVWEAVFKRPLASKGAGK